MTLVELIISISLVSILVLFCTMLISPLMKITNESNDRIQAKAAAQAAMAYMKEEIHCAQEQINVGSNEGPNVYYVNENGLLVNNGAIASGLDANQMTGMRFTIRFLPQEHAVRIVINIYSEEGLLLYQTSTNVSALDPNMVYQGTEGNVLSLTKRKNCP